MNMNTNGRTLNKDTTIKSGILTIDAADGTAGGSKGIIFRSGSNIPNDNNYNCSVLTYDHDGQRVCDGLSINGWDGISFCAGSNTRAERMRINSAGNTNIAGDLSIGNGLVYLSKQAMQQEI
jgi:hypothetical protein